MFSQTPKFVSGAVKENSCLAECLGPEKLASGIIVLVPGKDGALGLLAIGSRVPRKFGNDEEEFLVNVANLLGLTVQNIALFESAAISRTQWRDTLIRLMISSSSIPPTAASCEPIAPFRTAFTWSPWLSLARKFGKCFERGTAHWIRCPYCEGVAGKAEEIDPSFGGYFLATDSALHGSEGGRLGTIHVLKDFTSRRLAENKFRNLFEKAQEGVFIATPDGRLLDCNDALTRLFGYEDRDELWRRTRPEKFYVDISRPAAPGVAMLERIWRSAGFRIPVPPARRRESAPRTYPPLSPATTPEPPSPIRGSCWTSPSASRRKGKFAAATRNCWRSMPSETCSGNPRRSMRDWPRLSRR